MLRKRMYKAPHTRHRNSTYYRENRNLVKTHQKEYEESHAPVARRKKDLNVRLWADLKCLTDINIMSMMLLKMKKCKKIWNDFHLLTLNLTIFLD